MELLDRFATFIKGWRQWLQGRPSFILSGFLLLEAAFIVWAALKWPPEAKAALAAWVTFP